MNLILNTSFKGNRKYLQGGDLFNSVNSFLENKFSNNNIYIKNLKFNRFTYTAVSISFQNENPQDRIAEGEFIVDGELNKFYLQKTNVSPKDRVDFDEESMIKRACFEGVQAKLSVPLEFSAIEVIVSLTKALNYKLESPKSGKWVFGRVDLFSGLPKINSNLIIRNIKNISGRFSINEIIIDGILVGNIQFVVGEP